jgi:uncharacterized BrkB/YihY/UPF0761 family membrane protein
MVGFGSEHRWSGVWFSVVWVLATFLSFCTTIPLYVMPNMQFRVIGSELEQSRTIVEIDLASQLPGL